MLVKFHYVNDIATNGLSLFSFCAVKVLAAPPWIVFHIKSARLILFVFDLIVFFFFIMRLIEMRAYRNTIPCDQHKIKSWSIAQIKVRLYLLLQHILAVRSQSYLLVALKRKRVHSLGEKINDENLRCCWFFISARNWLCDRWQSNAINDQQWPAVVCIWQ